MTTQISDRLSILCNTIPSRLRQISEHEFTFKPSLEKWSKKELLGHLIDSATNNHQRFVRAQFETPTIFYQQNEWVTVQRYQIEYSETLIQLWEAYNRHLAHVIKEIPFESLQNIIIGRDGDKYTLEYVVEDYLTHLEYHLAQILN